MSLPPCPKCQSEYTYEDGAQHVCPECAHEWNEADAAAASDDALEVKDANGAVLKDGDTVVLIKDLKVKGSSMVIKALKSKASGLQEGDHNISQNRWQRDELELSSSKSLKIYF